MPMNVRKIKAGSVNTTVDLFIGEDGILFYDNNTGALRLSDGHTPGGIPLTTATYIATTTTLGQVKVDGTTITVDQYGVISAVGGGGGDVDWLNVSSDILPASDVTYSLGSSTRQWHSLYVSSTTVYINNIPLTVNNQGELFINGSQFIGPQGEPGEQGPAGIGGTTDLGKFVIVDDPGLAILSTTGTGYDILIAATQGEGAQYIIIPTNENAALGNNLIIGTSTATSAVEIQSYVSSWIFGTDGTLTAPGHILPDADLAYDLGSTSSQWRSIYVGTGTIYIGGVALGVNADNYVTVDGNPIITVDTANNLTIPGETDLSIVVGGGSLGNVEVAEVDEWDPPGGVWRLFIVEEDYPTLGDIVQIGDTFTTSWGTPITATITDIVQESGDWKIHVEQDITAGFNGYDTVTFSSVSGKIWRFDTDGVLTLPGGNTRIGDFYGNGGSIVGNTGTSVGVLVQGQGGLGGIQWIDNPDLIGTTSTVQVASVIVNSPIASTTGTVQILTGITTGTGIGSNIWEFGADGNLTIPDDIQDANGSVVRVATTSTAPTRVDGQLWFDNQEGRLYIKNDGLWLDASPTQIPSPETYLDGLAIDGTVIGTANVNGDAIVIDGGDNTKLTVSNNSVTIQVPGSLTRSYWAAEFGGITTAVTTSSAAVGTGAFYDSQGNVYVLGGVQFDTNEMFGLDSLLLKYDTNGNLLWSRTWHDDSGANCGAVNQAFAIDSNDRIYWLATALDPTFGCWTGYMDTEGNLGLGGVAQASLGFIDGAFAGVDIACDNSGNYYLAGAFYDGNEIPAVIKVDGDSGVPIWTGSIIPEDFESLPSEGVYRAVTVNPATGDVWAIGDYYDGGLRAMLSKWDINGSHQWTKELVTTTGDVAAAVIYNGGYVYTIVNDDPDQKAVISKFDTDGVLIWASFLAVGALDPIPNEFGDPNTGAYDLSFDAVGNVYVTGTIPGPPAGQPQLWITKLDPVTGEMLYSRVLITNAGLLIFDNFSFGFGASGHRVGDIYQDTIVVTAVTESDIDDNTGTNALRVIVAQLPIDGSVTGTFDNIDIVNITSEIDSICSTGTYTVTTLVWSIGTSTAITSTSSISVSTVTDVVGLTGETITLGSGTAGGSTTTNTWTFVNNNIILPPGGDILDSYGNSVLGDRYIALPSWITVVADTEHLPTLNTDYGWDSSGAWSTNATILGVEEPEGTSFPFRTTFSIPNDTKSVTTVDFVVNDLEESDFGITVFASGTNPTWEWGGSGSSIDAKYTPTELNGISGGGGGADWTPPSLGTYRARLTVDPTGPGTADITLETLTTGGTVLDTITYTETDFFGTNYKIGFASDNDGGVNKTYFKNLTINIDNGATVYTDTLMNGDSVGGSTTALGDRLTAGSNSVVLSSTGTLTLPNGGVIGETLIGDATYNILLTPKVQTGHNPDMAVKIYPTFSDDDHIHITAGNIATVDLFLGDDDQYVKLEQNHGNIVVGTNTTVSNSTWTFGTDGVLTLPAGSSRVTSYGQITMETDNGGSGIYLNATGVNLVYANTNVTLRSNSTGTTNDWTFGTDGVLTLSTASVILGNSTDPNVYIETATTSTTNTWTFAADGMLTLPQGGIIADTTTTMILTPNSPGQVTSLVLRSTYNSYITADYPTDQGYQQYLHQLDPVTYPDPYVSTGTEGTVISITLWDSSGSQYAQGDVEYIITGTGITAADFTPAVLTGTFAAANWTLDGGGFNYTNTNMLMIADDAIVEGQETFTITIITTGTYGHSNGSNYLSVNIADGTSEGSESGHIHLISENMSQTSIFLGNDDKYVKVGSDDQVYINVPNADSSGTSQTWTFGTDGSTTLPANSSILTNETALKIATHSTTTYTFNQSYWEALNGNATRMLTITGNAQYFSCTVTANQDGTYTVADLTGNSFEPGDWFKVPGNELGGATPANDIQINIATVDGEGVILTTTITGTAVGKQWNFGPDGSTTLPIGVSIDEYYGSHFPRIVADTGKAFSIQGQGSTGSVALQWIETASTSSQIAQVGLNKFGDGLANVVLTAGASTPTLKVWRFDETGTTTFPDGTTSTGAVIRAAQSSSYIIQTLGSAEASPSNVLSTFEFGVDGNLTLPGNIRSNSNIDIVAADGAATAIANWNGQGGWNQGSYINTATTGGSGTGLTVDVAAAGAGYINTGTITINNPGTGYTDGDVITINNENNLPGTFTISVTTPTWTFGTDGSLTLPGDLVTPSNIQVGTTATRGQVTIVGNSTATLGMYNTNVDVGAQIYLGDSNFNNSTKWNSAPGVGATYDNNFGGLAGALGLYTYSGNDNSRSLQVTVRANSLGVRIHSTSTADGSLTAGALVVAGGATIDKDLYVNGDIVSLDNLSITANTSTWTFGTDGKLTTPGNLQVNGGKIILNTGGNAYVESVDYGVNTATSALNIFGGPYQKIKLRAGFGTEATWTFSSTGTITFPDATVQSSAYVAANVVNKTSGSWTLSTGSNTVSITVTPGGNYQMWVNGNIPNGIVTWNATVSTSNTNVPVVGVQYGWYYAVGNALVLTSMPNQIVGTAGSISTATVATTSSNVFTFGITNNSTSSQVINWGYTTL